MTALMGKAGASAVELGYLDIRLWRQVWGAMGDRDNPNLDEEGIDAAVELLLGGLLDASWYASDVNGDPALDLSGDFWGLGSAIWIPDSDDPPTGFRPMETPSIWAFVEKAAASAVTGLAVRGTPFRLQFACRADEFSADAPTAVILYLDDAQLGAFDRHGRFDFVEEPVFPWRRFSRTDCVIAGDPGRPLVAPPFPGRKDGDRFWELLGANGERPLLSRIADLGPWSPATGALMVFSSRDEARFGEEVLRARVWVDRSGLPLDHPPSARPQPIGDLYEWMQERLMSIQLPGAKFVVDAHLPRHVAGFGDPMLGPVVRTTTGWWRVEPRNSLVLDHVCHQWHGVDTIHWNNTFGWRAEVPSSSYELNALEAVRARLGSSRREQDRVVANSDLWRGSPPGDLASSYVLAVTDTMTEESSFRFFVDEVAAIAWLHQYEQSFDLPSRIDGRKVAGALPARPSSSPAYEAHVSIGYRQACEALVRRALAEDYKPSHARDVAAMANSLLKNLRVEICGYTTDVAHALRSSTDPTNPESEVGSMFNQELLYRAVGLDAEVVRSRLVERGAYEVEPQIAQKCKNRVGEDVWQALSPESRWFLSAAIAHVVGPGTPVRGDHAGYTIQLCRVLEFELGRACRAARTSLVDHERPAADVSPLARFLAGGRDLTIGELVHYLANRADGEYDSELAPAFRAALRDNLGLSVLMSGKFLERLRSLNRIRNVSAHNTPVTELEARRCSELVLGDIETRDGLLARFVPLLRPQDDGVRPVADPDIAGNRRIEPDHLSVSFNSWEIGEWRAAQGFDEADGDGDDFPGLLMRTRLTDEVSIAMTSDGLAHLFVGVMAPDGAFDAISRTWIGETVERLSNALSRRVVNWRHRDGTAVETDQRTGGLRVMLRLDSGRTVTVRLDAAGRATLTEIVRSLLDGKWGQLHRGKAPPSAAEAGSRAVEMMWARLQRDRERRVATQRDVPPIT